MLCSEAIESDDGVLLNRFLVKQIDRDLKTAPHLKYQLSFRAVQVMPTAAAMDVISSGDSAWRGTHAGAPLRTQVVEHASLASDR